MASSRSNLLGLGETPAQYFDRFDNTWEPDPDRPGLVRRKDPEINHDDIDDESFEERRVKRRRSNLVIPRTPDTIEVTRVMPLRPGETPAQYFDRFDNTWEPDPDRPGLVRRKAAEGVEDTIRRNQEEFHTTIQVRRGDIDPEFDSARQVNNYTTLADDTSEALPDIDTHPREEAPILVESSSEDSE